uniref:Bicarbonate transporter-like transmembrane domain-containing protein n=1 Tax=Megaselia scalaris TaxID=36166 RepID=T1H4R6_MEGSC
MACLIVLWSIKSFPQTSILFPLMLVVMIGIRKLLDLVFTRRELKILDDIMPEITKRQADDDLNRLEDGEDHNNEHMFGKQQLNEAFHSSNMNITIPLSNENSDRNTALNLTEEVNRTSIWKNVNLNDQRESRRIICDQIIIPVPLKPRKINGNPNSLSCNEDVTTLDKPLNLSSAQYHKQLLSMPEEKEIEEIIKRVIKRNIGADIVLRSPNYPHQKHQFEFML